MAQLYVRAVHSNNKSGDLIFDKKIIKYINKYAATELLEIQPSSRVFSALKTVTKKIPPFASRYRSNFIKKRLEQLLKERDFKIVILSHSFTAQYVKSIPSHKTVIFHNIESDLYKYDKSYLGKITSLNSRSLEDQILHLADSVIVLSEHDKDLLIKRTNGRTSPIILRPGMPEKKHFLASNAKFLPEFVLTGTYSWRLKAKDLNHFVKNYKKSKISRNIRVENSLLSRLKKIKDRVKQIDGIDLCNYIRMGLITDKFIGGFKLKALEYISMNCMVIAFSNIRSEFRTLPYFKKFIYYAESFEDFIKILNQLSQSNSKNLVNEFVEFKKACYKKFDWEQNVKEAFSIETNLNRKKRKN